VALVGASACPDDEQPTEPTLEEELEAVSASMSCAADSDCEVVDIMCGGRAAAPHERAGELRREWGEQAAISECVRALWAPPDELRAFCEGGVCVLDTVSWPAFRSCEADGECVAFEDDPCGPPTAVHRDHLEEARELITATSRAASCATRASALRTMLGTDIADAKPGVDCHRGFCRH